MLNILLDPARKIHGIIHQAFDQHINLNKLGIIQVLIVNAVLRGSLSA